MRKRWAPAQSGCLSVRGGVEKVPGSKLQSPAFWQDAPGALAVHPSRISPGRGSGRNNAVSSNGWGENAKGPPPARIQEGLESLPPFLVYQNFTELVSGRQIIPSASSYRYIIGGFGEYVVRGIVFLGALLVLEIYPYEEVYRPGIKRWCVVAHLLDDCVVHCG